MARHTYGFVPLVAALLIGSTLVGSALQQRRPRFDRQWGPVFRPGIAPVARRHGFPLHWYRQHPQQARAMLLHWNDITLDANALDHTVPLFEDDVVYGDQLGPTRTSRAFAIVHIAMFDAVNAIAGKYDSYSDVPRAPLGTSMTAAIAQAAHDTLVVLYPTQKESFDQELSEDLAGIPDGPGKVWGNWLGRTSAALILNARENDGSAAEDPEIGAGFFPSPLPGKWRPDPISMIPIALGATWGNVKPFVIPSAERFGVPPPPELTSEEYADAFNEVKRLGGDGMTTPTERTEEQTFIGVYWGYDGTPNIGTPPRFFNRITIAIAEQKETEVVELARLLALVNVAMADATIAVWKTKFVYQFWRPVTGIREADPGTGPTGLGDGNPDTTGDPNFTPLGAPASNLSGPNFTPPFPSYTSGHGGLAGSVFQTLRRFFGTDRIAFTQVSDEFNGINRDNMGIVRPLRPRSFQSLSQAEEECGQSRIYLGIHWQFDKTDGIDQGRRVADAVFRRAFQRKY